jgi:peptidoglycan/xylan/chitin deacetylase (PgdA/CDA1 family)
MSRRSTAVVKAALKAMHFSGASTLLAPWTRGAGAILTLHQVCPEPPDHFAPNRILKITPEFLDRTIRSVIEAGFEVLSLDDLHFRLTEGTLSRPFVAFTLDDGYRDNLKFAYPVFKRYGVPFTVYVPTDYPDGHGELWWLALERAMSGRTQMALRIDGTVEQFKLRTPREKDAAFHRIYWWLRSIDERQARAVVRDLAHGAGIDIETLCRKLIMSWDEVRELASDPLVTIGAHTRRHFALAKLPLAEARAEMVESIVRLERELNQPIRHFSYPFGDETSAGPREFMLARELGLKTAVTTRKGVLDLSHARSLTALPRVSINGDYQDTRLLRVLLTGAPFRLMNLAQSVVPKAARIADSRT